MLYGGHTSFALSSTLSDRFPVPWQTVLGDCTTTADCAIRDELAVCINIGTSASSTTKCRCSAGWSSTGFLLVSAKRRGGKGRGVPVMPALSTSQLAHERRGEQGRETNRIPDERASEYTARDAS